MQKAPYRHSNEISQSYNDGILDIYVVTNIAKAGYKPKACISWRSKIRFNEQRLGLNRLYLSRQNQIEIERVVRVQRGVSVSTSDIAVINEKQYRIDTVQSVTDVYPPSFDLALVRLGQEYEVVL